MSSEILSQHSSQAAGSGKGISIGRRTAEYTRVAGIDAVWLLERMKNIADADLSRVFDENGALIPPSLWPDELKRCIASVKVVEMQGGIAGEDGAKRVPMYTKEMKLEARVPSWPSCWTGSTVCRRPR